MCLALCHPDPGLKPEGTGDSLWRRTEEDLRGRAQHRIQSHPVQDVSTAGEVAKVELTWTLSKEWPGSLGLEYFFFCGQQCWDPHEPGEMAKGVAISFLHPFLWFFFPLRGSIKVLGFFPTKNPFCRVETAPESWTHLFSPSLTCL